MRPVTLQSANSQYRRASKTSFTELGEGRPSAGLTFCADTVRMTGEHGFSSVQPGIGRLESDLQRSRT
jgi:hypothetical protein